MIRTALLSLPANLVVAAASTGGASSFDATTLVETSVNNASSQMYSALGVVVPVIAGIVVAVVVVKFGLKWIKKLNSAG